MREAGHRVTQAPVPKLAGTFVAPTLIELDGVDQLEAEVFGPVLHVVRYARRDLDRTIDAINEKGFGLTFGLHTRLDETVAHVTERIRAGNIYVNRNIIGAVVGVQPFGGSGKSGTGPKAGGPLYLRRLVKGRPAEAEASSRLPGPVGESNLYALRPRGEVLLLPTTREGLSRMLDAVAATRNTAVIDATMIGENTARELAPDSRISGDWSRETAITAVLAEGDAARLAAVAQAVAAWPGPIVPVQSASNVNRDMLVHEVSISINTAAAGGNATLMAMRDT
jgi:RHH-type proline utilization regulon transcriptional repressor/proline dehydrogenase/delta 1-pyrroline-5-carboxylate dehydrogenase